MTITNLTPEEIKWERRKFERCWIKANGTSPHRTRTKKGWEFTTPFIEEHCEYWLARAAIARQVEKELREEVERLLQVIFPDSYLSGCANCGRDTLGQDGMCCVCQFDELCDSAKEVGA